VVAAAALHEGDITGSLLGAMTKDAEAVDEAIDGGWLVEGRDELFRLRSSPETIRSLAPWSARRAAHLVLAAWQTRQPQGAAKAAAHFEAGGEADEAGRWWLTAARSHCRRHQHRAAARCFAEAIRLMPDSMADADLVEAVDDFGVCASLQRDPREAIELLERWRERPGWKDHLAFQGAAARVLAGLLSKAGRHVDSAHVRRFAAGCFERLGKVEVAAAEWLAAATTLVFALHLSAGCEAVRRAIELGRACGRADFTSQAHTVLGLAQGMLGETESGRKSLETALDEALGAGLTTQAADAYRVLGNVSEYASCYRDEQAAFNRALSYCRRHDEDHVSELCLGCYSYSLFRSGNWRRSLALARSIVDTRSSSVVSRCVADGVLGLLFAHRGEVKTALARSQACLQASRQTGIVAMAFFAWWGLALAREAEGDLDGAGAAYRSLFELWQGTEDRHDAVPGLTCAVSFFAGQGDDELAARIASALQRVAGLNPNPEMIGAASFAAAELDLLAGRAAEAVGGFAEALRCYEQRDLSIERVRARLRLGVALAAAGEVGRAREAWREARLGAARLGARPLAALAGAAERGVCSPEVRPETITVPADALSPRQRDVAQHLAAGRTNKEIAAHLGLSVRTVDMHVAHVLARLDCRTRTEAVAKLAVTTRRAPD
jgi:DNA-binding CsgD family transcriptional regulator/tetratricopeptide (TPR) repeat protein